MVKYFNKLLCQVFIKKINHPYNKRQNKTTKWVLVGFSYFIWRCDIIKNQMFTNTLL